MLFLHSTFVRNKVSYASSSVATDKGRCFLAPLRLPLFDGLEERFGGFVSYDRTDWIQVDGPCWALEQELSGSSGHRCRQILLVDLVSAVDCYFGLVHCSGTFSIVF